MSQASNVSNILFSNAFTTDLVCGLYTGSYNAADYNTVLGGYLYQYDISHNFTRPVFCEGIFSFDGTNYFPSGQGNGTNSCIAYSDSSNLYLTSSASSGTIYYKIITTWIQNYDTSNPLVTFANNVPNPSSSFAFDSRENYQKIDLTAQTTLNNPGSGNTGTTTIAHNLGYSPNYQVFYEAFSGQVWPEIGNGNTFWLYDFTSQYTLQGYTNTSDLTLSYQGGTSSPSTFNAWYKVYYD